MSHFCSGLKKFHFHAWYRKWNCFIPYPGSPRGGSISSLQYKFKFFVWITAMMPWDGSIDPTYLPQLNLEYERSPKSKISIKYFYAALKKNPSPTDKVTYRVACAITINTNSNDYQETYAFSLCGKVHVKWICFRSWRTFSRLGNFWGICMRYLIRFLQWWYHSLKSCNTTTSPFTKMKGKLVIFHIFCWMILLL